MRHFTISLPNNLHGDVRWGTIKRKSLFLDLLKGKKLNSEAKKGYIIRVEPTTTDIRNIVYWKRWKVNGRLKMSEDFKWHLMMKLVRRSKVQSTTTKANIKEVYLQSICFLTFIRWPLLFPWSVPPPTTDQISITQGTARPPAAGRAQLVSFTRYGSGPSRVNTWNRPAAHWMRNKKVWCSWAGRLHATSEENADCCWSTTAGTDLSFLPAISGQ